MKKILLLFQVSFLIFLTSCSSSFQEDDIKFGKGYFIFSMKDSAGKKLADGILDVKTYSNNNISGTYEFTKIYQNDFPGLSSMKGKFEGNIITEEKRVFINTNPKIADSNVFWNLTIMKDYLKGEWSYSTMRGTVNKGTVKIKK